MRTHNDDQAASKTAVTAAAAAATAAAAAQRHQSNSTGDAPGDGINALPWARTLRATPTQAVVLSPAAALAAKSPPHSDSSSPLPPVSVPLLPSMLGICADGASTAPPAAMALQADGSAALSESTSASHRPHTLKGGSESHQLESLTECVGGLREELRQLREAQQYEAQRTRQMLKELLETRRGAPPDGGSMQC